jgi:hypothetical protein
MVLLKFRPYLALQTQNTVKRQCTLFFRLLSSNVLFEVLAADALRAVGEEVMDPLRRLRYKFWKRIERH